MKVVRRPVARRLVVHVVRAGGPALSLLRGLPAFLLLLARADPRGGGGGGGKQGVVDFVTSVFTNVWRRQRSHVILLNRLPCYRRFHFAK